MNPEIMATSHLSHWFPPDRRLPALLLSLRDTRRPSAGSDAPRVYVGLVGHGSSPTPDGLNDLLEPPLLSTMVEPAMTMGE